MNSDMFFYYYYLLITLERRNGKKVPKSIAFFSPVCHTLLWKIETFHRVLIYHLQKNGAATLAPSERILSDYLGARLHIRIEFLIYAFRR